MLEKLNLDENKLKYILIFSIMFIFLFFIYSLFFWQQKINNIQKSIEEKENKLKKILLLSEEIKFYKKNQINYSNNLLLFVQELGEKNKINKKIVSTKPLYKGTYESVRVIIKGITLDELLNIFKFIKKYGNIEIKQFVITRNFTSSDLLDLDLILRKKKI